MTNASYMNDFDLTRYLTNGVQNIVANAIKSTLKAPQGKRLFDALYLFF